MYWDDKQLPINWLATHGFVRRHFFSADIAAKTIHHSDGNDATSTTASTTGRSITCFGVYNLHMLMAKVFLIKGLLNTLFCRLVPIWQMTSLTILPIIQAMR